MDVASVESPHALAFAIPPEALLLAGSIGGSDQDATPLTALMLGEIAHTHDGDSAPNASRWVFTP